MAQRTNILLILAAIVICMGAVFAIYCVIDRRSTDRAYGLFADIETLRGSVVTSSLLPAAESAKDGVLVPLAFPPPIVGGKKFYKSFLLRFSILFPKDLSVKEYDEGAGSLIVFEDAAGEKGFQVYVVPYDKEKISKEQFTMDVPSGVMEEPTEIVIDGTHAAMFLSKNAILGDTREVWFIKNGFLYEVTTYKALDTWLANIMKSWRFL